MAFQKWQRLGRDGVAGPGDAEGARDRRAPDTADDRCTGTRVEVLLDRQLALLIRDGASCARCRSRPALPASTTPPGSYTVFRKEDRSWSVPYKVWLPWASYFVGGIAFHESPDVPAQPASHGCVRTTHLRRPVAVPADPERHAGDRARPVMSERGVLLIARRGRRCSCPPVAAAPPRPDEDARRAGRRRQPRRAGLPGRCGSGNEGRPRPRVRDRPGARARASGSGSRRSSSCTSPSSRGSTPPAPKPWDVAVAEITITAARRANVDFSAPYLAADQGVLLAEGVAEPKSLADLAGAPALRPARHDVGRRGRLDRPADAQARSSSTSRRACSTRSTSAAATR